MEENTVFCNNIDLQWLNHPAETCDIFPVSFSGGFLTLISKLDLVIPFFSPCKLNLSPGRFTMVRKQDTQLGEKVGLCSCCIVHFNKAHRLFSLFLQQRSLFSFLFFFEREREFIQIWYYLLQIYHTFPGLSAEVISLKLSCSLMPE